MSQEPKADRRAPFELGTAGPSPHDDLAGKLVYASLLCTVVFLMQSGACTAWGWIESQNGLLLHETQLTGDRIHDSGPAGVCSTRVPAHLRSPRDDGALNMLVWFACHMHRNVKLTLNCCRMLLLSCVGIEYPRGATAARPAASNRHGTADQFQALVIELQIAVRNEHDTRVETHC
jgi:hypothetical protein